MIDLSWLKPENVRKVEGHMTVTKEIEDFWVEVKKQTNFKNLMEIGFNAGHSSAFVLSLLPDVRVDSYDICFHPYTKPNSLKVKKKFGKRFDFFQTDSRDIKPEVVAKNKYDILFVDGNHKLDFVENDFNIAFGAKIPFMVVDDLHQKDVKIKFEEHLKKESFSLLHRSSYLATTGQLVQVALVKNRCEI
jgi:hypothetical protein